MTKLHSLKAKLFLYSIPATLGMLIIFGIILGFFAQKTILEAAEEQIEDTVVAMQLLVGEWIGGIHMQLHDTARSSLIRTMDQRQYRPRLDELIANSQGLYDYVFVVDPQGDYLNREGAIGNVKDRGYFQDIFQARKPFTVSNAIISRGSGKPVITVGLPIHNSQGALIGMLAATVHIHALTEKIGMLDFGQEGFSFLIDGTGMCIAHSTRPNLIMQLNVIQSSQRGYVGLDQAGQAMARGERGIVQFNQPDSSIIHLFFQPIPHTPNWSLGVGIPDSQIRSRSAYLIGIVALIFIAVMGTIILVVYITGILVANPIKEVVSELRRFGELDLTKKKTRADDYLGRKDEIGQMSVSLVKMVKAFRESLHAIRKAVEEMNQSAADLAGVSQQQLASSEELASQAQGVDQNVQNTSSSIEEVSSGVEEVAASAQSVSKTAQELATEMQDTSLAVQNGMKAVQEAIRSIEDAEKQTRQTSQVAAEVANQAKEVGQIVDTISSISEQTNLLALNAAIEAARAGEAGRGFAVVADEIRKLAEESKGATTNIIRILKQLSEGVKQADTASNKTVDLVLKVQKEGAHIEKQFTMITSSVDKINNMIENLTATSEQQGAAAQEMASAMDSSAKSMAEIAEDVRQIATGVDQQSKGAQQVSASAEQLSNLAQNLEMEAQKFQLSEE